MACVFKWVIGKGRVPEKVLCELRPLQNECVSHIHIGGTALQAEGKASARPQGGDLQWPDGVAQRVRRTVPARQTRGELRTWV